MKSEHEKSELETVAKMEESRHRSAMSKFDSERSQFEIQITRKDEEIRVINANYVCHAL